MMNLSLYSSIGLVVFAVVAVIGIAAKIIFRVKRKKLDGIHGFVHKEEIEKNAGDGWKIL